MNWATTKAGRKPRSKEETFEPVERYQRTARLEKRNKKERGRGGSGGGKKKSRKNGSSTEGGGKSVPPSFTQRENKSEDEGKLGCVLNKPGEKGGTSEWPHLPVKIRGRWERRDRTKGEGKRKSTEIKEKIGLQ